MRSPRRHRTNARTRWIFSPRIFRLPRYFAERDIRQAAHVVDLDIVDGPDDRRPTNQFRPVVPQSRVMSICHLEDARLSYRTYVRHNAVQRGAEEHSGHSCRGDSEYTADGRLCWERQVLRTQQTVGKENLCLAGQRWYNLPLLVWQLKRCDRIRS